MTFSWMFRSDIIMNNSRLTGFFQLKHKIVDFATAVLKYCVFLARYTNSSRPCDYTLIAISVFFSFSTGSPNVNVLFSIEIKLRLFEWVRVVKLSLKFKAHELCAMAVEKRSFSENACLRLDRSKLWKNYYHPDITTTIFTSLERVGEWTLGMNVVTFLIF